MDERPAHERPLGRRCEQRIRRRVHGLARYITPDVIERRDDIIRLYGNHRQHAELMAALGKPTGRISIDYWATPATEHHQTTSLLDSLDRAVNAARHDIATGINRRHNLQ